MRLEAILLPQSLHHVFITRMPTLDPVNRSQQVASTVASWRDWLEVQRRGCVPDNQYCEACLRAQVCDESCLLLPVCGTHPSA
jgi:hypothetical protein